MKWSDEYLNLKPIRGKRLALKVYREDPYKVLCEKAIEKWKAYNPDLYSENKTYVLLLDSGKEANFLPGPGKEFFHWDVIKRKLERTLRELLCTCAL